MDINEVIEKYNGLPDFIYPELVSDEIIDCFEQYDGQNLPEDIEELTELSNKLSELREVVFKIHEEIMMAFSIITKGLNNKADKLGKNRYNLSEEEMTVNDVLITICYPFFDRWGGSFEARFAIEGYLIKYLKMYKEKIGGNMDTQFITNLLTVIFGESAAGNQFNIIEGETETVIQDMLNKLPEDQRTALVNTISGKTLEEVQATTMPDQEHELYSLALRELRNPINSRVLRKYMVD